LSNVEGVEVEQLAVAVGVARGGFVVVVEAVRLELSLLDRELDLFLEEEGLGLERLVLRQPPPTGTLRRTPPLVQ